MTTAPLHTSITTLVQCLPPPYGGVSVHVARLHQRLRATGADSRVIVNLPLRQPVEGATSIGNQPWSTLAWTLGPGRATPPDIFHAHTLLKYTAYCDMMADRARAVVFTFHDQMLLERYRRQNPLAQWYVRRLLRRDNAYCIAVSDTVREMLLTLGAPDAHITVIPAFIMPPPPTTALPAAVESFLAAHSPVLLVYGAAFKKLNGVDIYGFDMAIAAAKNLLPDFPRLGLLVLGPKPVVTPNLVDVPGLIARSGAAPAIHYLEHGAETHLQLFPRIAAYLRPSATDGDSLMLREALALGAPTVASDAAPRPERVILFPSRDQTAFEAAIRRTLADDRPRQPQPDDDYFPEVLALYQQILQRHPAR